MCEFVFILCILSCKYCQCGYTLPYSHEFKLPLIIIIEYNYWNNNIMYSTINYHIISSYTDYNRLYYTTLQLITNTCPMRAFSYVLAFSLFVFVDQIYFHVHILPHIYICICLNDFMRTQYIKQYIQYTDEQKAKSYRWSLKE